MLVNLRKLQALVAQGIEHGFPKPGVVGSSPTESTKFIALKDIYSSILSYRNQKAR